MSHLFTMRKGWESEHLAHYLLSQISFISNPSIIGDDIGSDFICTLFEINKKKNKDFLIPKNSFAIQIKSNSRRINLTDKIGYLANLEIPFTSALIFMIQFTNDSHVNTFMKLFQSGNYFNLSLKTNLYVLMNQTKA